MRFLIIFLFLLTNSFASEVPDIKNLIINKEYKKYDSLTFLDAKNQKLNLDSYKGNLIILNFWATWCAPCKREMPSLSKLSEKYPEIQVYTINMEKPNNSKVDDFFKSIEVSNLKTYYDPEFKLVKQLRMRGVPTSILINKEGNEFGRVVGEVDFMSEYFLDIIQKYI